MKLSKNLYGLLAHYAFFDPQWGLLIPNSWGSCGMAVFSFGRSMGKWEIMLLYAWASMIGKKNRTTNEIWKGDLHMSGRTFRKPNGALIILFSLGATPKREASTWKLIFTLRSEDRMILSLTVKICPKSERSIIRWIIARMIWVTELRFLND